MRLNLTIIADYLKESSILHRNTDRMADRTLKYPVFYHGEQELRPDRLYVAEAETLPVNPTIREACSLICLGYPPQRYHEEDCQLLCFPAHTDQQRLFNRISDIFDRFYDYETRIHQAMLEQDPWSGIGDIFFEIFQNPIYGTGPYDEFLFVKYDPARPEFLERYQYHETQEYYPEDERNVNYADPEFSRVYEPRRAFYCDAAIPIYGTGGIVYNLFEEDRFRGCIFFEDVYRPPADSDYPLLEWAGEFVRQLLKNYYAFRGSDSQEMKSMLEKLLVSHLPYQKEYGTVLRACGWRSQHSYRVVCVRFLHPFSTDHARQLYECAEVMRTVFRHQFVLVLEHMVVLLVNMSLEQIDIYSLSSKLKAFTHIQEICMGVGCECRDFPELWQYYRQACMALELAAAKRKESVVLFEQNLLELLLSQTFGENSYWFYLSPGLKRLMAYDEENNGEMMLTLKCYLKNNLSGTRTQEELHIARTTCLYRVKRIEEIGGFSLNDPDTALYLKIMTRVME